MSSSGALKPPSQTLNFNESEVFPWNLGSFLVGLANKSISIGSDFPASASLEATRRRSELVVLIQHLAIFKCQHAQRSKLSPQSFHLNGHPSLSRLRVARDGAPFCSRAEPVPEVPEVPEVYRCIVKGRPGCMLPDNGMEDQPLRKGGWLQKNCIAAMYIQGRLRIWGSEDVS